MNMREQRLYVAPDFPAKQLFVLLCTDDSSAQALQPLAQRLAQVFEHSAVVQLQLPLDSHEAQVVAEAAHGLAHQLQQIHLSTGTDPVCTAVVGIGPAATAALQTLQQEVLVCARLFAIGAQWRTVPAQIPPELTLHLIHGKKDEQVPYKFTVDAAYALVAQHADFTADVLPFETHTLSADMINLIIERLQSYVPKRVWDQAMQAAAQS